MDDASRDRILSEQLLDRLGRIEDLVKDVPVMKEMLVDHGERLERIETRLDVHEDILREHSIVLREHSADLSELKQLVGGQMEKIADLHAVAHTHS